jgi:hypothetical protein
MVDTRSVLRSLVSGLVIAMGVCGAANAENAAGKPAGSDTAAVPPPAVKILEAGDVRAELLTIAEDKTLTAGSSAFAQIKLSTIASARRGVDAYVLVEASNGQAVTISGSGAKPKDKSSSAPGVKAEPPVHPVPTARAQVDGLRRGRDRNLLVEVKLPAAETDRVTLKVTVGALSRDKGQAMVADSTDRKAVAEIAWSVKDCAGGYYGALKQIREQGDWQASEKWKAAAKPDANLPRNWLFPPKEERRSRRRRRSEPEVTASSRIQNQREIFTQAGRFVRAGHDPELERDGDLGWVLGKVAGDLDNYLAQPSNPAICTGALGLADWYEKRLGDLVRRGERLSRLAADAKLLAQEKVAAVFRVARELSAETPGWGGMPPVAVNAMTVRDENLAGMASSLAELAALPADALGKVRAAQAPYEALIAIHEAGIEREGMPEAVRDGLRGAFSAVDAAARLDAIHQRHVEMQNAFQGRIKAIREAHGKHCVCQS